MKKEQGRSRQQHTQNGHGAGAELLFLQANPDPEGGACKISAGAAQNDRPNPSQRYKQNQTRDRPHRGYRLPAPPTITTPRGRAIKMLWALCFDKRTQRYTITRNDRAKHFDFLEIINTGTYNQMLEAIAPHKNTSKPKQEQDGEQPQT